MSEQLVKLVERGYEAWNSGDRGWVLEHMSEDVARRQGRGEHGVRSVKWS
jgi:hypothetical protein